MSVRLQWPLIPLVFVVMSCAGPPPFPRAELDVEVPEQWRSGQMPGVLDEIWWQQFGSMDLHALVIEAVDENRDLAAASSRIAQAGLSQEIAGAELFPTLSAEFTGQRNRRNFIGFPSFGDGGDGGVVNTTVNTFGLSLATSWELDVWGRIRASVSAAYADAQAAAADFEAARLSLVGQVCKQWFAAVEADSQFQLAQDTAQSYQQTADQVRERYERGLRSSLDLRLALNAYHDAKALEAQRQNESQRARKALEVLLGRYPSGQLHVIDKLPELPPMTPLGIPSELIRRRPDVLAAERRLAALEARVDQARAELYPRFSLTANAGTQTEELKDLLDSDFFVWSLIGNIVQPIFEAGRLRNQVSLAEERVVEAYESWSGAVLTAFAEVETALEGEKILVERAQSLFESMDQARKALELAQDRYLEGLEDFISVSDAQRRLLTSESQYLTVRRNLLDQRVDLHLALGGGVTFEKLESLIETNMTNEEAD